MRRVKADAHEIMEYVLVWGETWVIHTPWCYGCVMGWRADPRARPYMMNFSMN